MESRNCTNLFYEYEQKASWQSWQKCEHENIRHTWSLTLNWFGSYRRNNLRALTNSCWTVWRIAKTISLTPVAHSWYTSVKESGRAHLRSAMEETAFINNKFGAGCNRRNSTVHLPNDQWEYIVWRTIVFVVEQKGIVLLYKEGWNSSRAGNDAHIGAISKRFRSSTSVRFSSIFASAPHITWYNIM